MGTIFATCGHELESMEDGVAQERNDYDGTYWGFYCKQCAREDDTGMSKIIPGTGITLPGENKITDCDIRKKLVCPWCLRTTNPLKTHVCPRPQPLDAIPSEWEMVDGDWQPRSGKYAKPSSPLTPVGEMVQKMAEDHCEYMLSVCRTDYLDAFKHGWKHGRADYETHSYWNGKRWKPFLRVMLFARSERTNGISFDTPEDWKPRTMGRGWDKKEGYFIRVLDPETRSSIHKYSHESKATKAVSNSSPPLATQYRSAPKLKPT